MPSRTGQYREIVDRAVDAARGCTQIRIVDICRAAGVSARTLSRAFHAIHGVAPHRHLHALRLRGARQMLLSAHEEPATVTEVATRFGFGELGRFAVAYRAAFGERPSATLRRSSESRRRPSSNVHKSRSCNHERTEASDETT